MKLVSSILKRVVYPSLARAGCLRRLGGCGLAAVTYHGVFPQGYDPVDPTLDGNLVSGETLRQQLRLLKAHYNVISPEDALAWREGRIELPQRTVLLTCDDGLLNCLTDMLPILQQEGIRCLFFVTAASAGEARSMLWYEELFLLFLGAPLGAFDISSEGVSIKGEMRGPAERRAIWWDSVKGLSQLDTLRRESFLRTIRTQFASSMANKLDDRHPSFCRRFALLTSAELRELAAAGMTIGAHSLSHPILSQLPADLAYSEIAECRTKLESAVQRRIWAFAYPFGDPTSVTPSVVSMAKEAGYGAAFLNFGGGLGTDLPAYALPRVHVTSEMDLAEFEAHVSGFYARLQRLAGRGLQNRFTA